MNARSVCQIVIIIAVHDSSKLDFMRRCCIDKVLLYIVVLFPKLSKIHQPCLVVRYRQVLVRPLIYSLR